MKTFLLKLKCLMPFLFSVCTSSAQLTIAPGAEFIINGDIPIALQNTDLLNDGFFAGDLNTISFTGNASSSISGAGSVHFFRVNVNKTGSQSVILHKSVDIISSVVFTSGFLDLNGFNVDLETTGNIIGENNNTRFIGANGGQILFRTTLNAPTNANPGNLGIILTSDYNLGQVTIKRGHQSQSGTRSGSSILRYYELSPANNSGLHATLQFNYFDEELNRLDESSLIFLKSDNAIDWSDIGFTSRNSVSNFVEKTGVNVASRFTLSIDTNSTSSVRIISFTLNCERNDARLIWKTAQEQNSNHFTVERSTDQAFWMVIATLPAAGTSNNEKTYFYTDNNTVQYPYYRIAEYDNDGTVHYTNILRSSCIVPDAFSLWPNPSHEKLFINIVAANGSQAQIKLYDSKGALVRLQKANVSQGSNQLTVNIVSLPKGIYHLSVEWNNGQTIKTTQVVKQ